MKKIKDIAEHILYRPLKVEEGLSEDAILSAEKKLGYKLPSALRDFYLAVGKMKLFTDAFEFFAQPKQIYEKAGKLIFLEENQAVLSWAVDIKELGNEVVKVYQSPNIGDSENEVVWFAENLSLPDFLEMIMYYQITSADDSLQKGTIGAYPYGFVAYKSDLTETDLSDAIEKNLANNWRKVVDYNGVVIHETNDALMLYYTMSDLDVDVDDLILLNTRKKDTLSEFRAKYRFEESGE